MTYSIKYISLLFMLTIAVNSYAEGEDLNKLLAQELLSKQDKSQEKTRGDTGNVSTGYKDTAVIQVLNKVTAVRKSFAIKVGSTQEVGTIKIYLKRCWQAPPEDLPENKVLLKVTEQKNDDNVLYELFHGWMFSSSAGLSPLEHPVYDISVLKCV
jgi:hypothetical protein